MNKLIFASAVNLLIILMALPCVSYAQVEERKGIVYTADFETGAIQGRSKPTIDATVGIEKSDAGYLKGMAAPLDGTCTPISTTSGGAAITSQEFTRVVTGTSVPIFTGKNSLRMQIHYNCNYNVVNGGTYSDPIGGERDKARTGFGVNGIALPFDEYVWLAWGMYIPSDWEVETYQVQTHLFQVTMGPSGAPGPYNFDVGKNSDLIIQIGINDKNTSHDGQTVKTVANLKWTDYRGRWVSVISRIRFNPFVTRTNTTGIADSTGKIYDGNRGSLELWIDEKKVVNYRGPIGYVPSIVAWTADMLVYKGNWKKTQSSVKGPITLYYDAIRIGLESRGANYKEVHPKLVACSDNCPGAVAPATIAPPENVVVK